MSPTPSSLRADAHRLEQEADECAAAAAILERQYHALHRRLEPVLRAHDEQVWASRAATASRLNLRITGTGQLGRSREDLLDVVATLRRGAIHRADVAAGNRRRAAELDAAADAAGLPYLPPHLAPPGYEPYREPVTPRGWGHR